VSEALEVGKHAGYEAQETIERIVTTLPNPRQQFVATATAFAVLLWKVEVFREADPAFVAIIESIAKTLYEAEKKATAK
jgi:hypothetical protein